MTIAVRLISNVITEIMIVPDGFTLEDTYSTADLKSVVQAPDNVKLGWVFDNGSFSAPLTPKQNPPSKDDLKAAAAAARYGAEVGGITVEGGVEIATDRDSQSMISNTLDYLTRNTTVASVNFKSEAGWMTIDAKTLSDIGIAVGAHVQACFDAEMALDKAINDGSVAALDDVAKWKWPG